VSDAVALRVDNNHGAATKDPETNRPHHSLFFDRGPQSWGLRRRSPHRGSPGLAARGCSGACRDQSGSPCRVAGAELLTGPANLDRHSQREREMLNEQVPPPVTPAPAQDVARRILGEDVTPIDYYTERVKRMVGKVHLQRHHPLRPGRLRLGRRRGAERRRARRAAMATQQNDPTANR
jgi:hypothetical protein